MWGHNVHCWGGNVYFGGHKVSSRGFSKILGFGDLFMFAGGCFGTLWVGGSCRGFWKKVTQTSLRFPRIPVSFLSELSRHHEKRIEQKPHVPKLHLWPSKPRFLQCSFSVRAWSPKHCKEKWFWGPKVQFWNVFFSLAAFFAGSGRLWFLTVQKVDV